MTLRFMAVDIGSTMVRAVAAERTDRGPRVLGTGTAASRGMRKGAVTDVEQAGDSIKAAVRSAESAAGALVRDAFIGITGQHIQGSASRGVIGLKARDITPEDRTRAIGAAESIYMPLHREVLHVVPAGFAVNSRTGPGMAGIRLESVVHIVTADSDAVRSVTQACARAGLVVRDMVFAPLATGGSILDPDELREGAVIVDIGGGTTDIALFRKGVMLHAAVIGIGGLHITNDLAVGLQVDVAAAEEIKRSLGVASQAALDMTEGDEVSLPGIGNKMISRTRIAEVVQARCEEIFEMAAIELGRSRMREAIASRMVLVGGTALMPGLACLASAVCGIPARVGLPKGAVNSSACMNTPEFAAATGLAIYAGSSGKCLMQTSGEEDGMIARMRSRLGQITGYKDFLEIMHRKKKGVSYV